MIRSKKHVGIIYGGEIGKKYADSLKDAIKIFGVNTGYAVTPVCVDDVFYSKERFTYDRVFNNLSLCDLYFVIISKDEENHVFARPNVLIELGYCLSKVGHDNVICILTFPFNKLIDDISNVPSDIFGTYYEIFSDNYDVDQELNKIVDKNLIIRDLHRLTPHSANETAKGLFNNPDYKTDYGDLFTEREKKNLSEYHYQTQLTKPPPPERRWVQAGG